MSYKKDVVVHIYYNYESGTDEYEKHFQYSGLCVVPRVGEKLSVYTNRDRNGNYYGKRDSKFLFSGVVEEVEYVVTQRGMDAQSTSLTVFVEIYVRGARDKK